MTNPRNNEPGILRGDGKRIIRFMNDHGLVDLVMQASDAIARVYGKSVSWLTLEMYDDPDCGGDERLFVLVCVNVDATCALELEDRFNDEWWFEHMEQAGGRLAFGLEFADA